MDPGLKDTETEEIKISKKDLKNEPMDEKIILIIDLEDLEPPAQKTGGAKGPLEIKNLINPVATNQTTGKFLNFNEYAPKENQTTGPGHGLNSREPSDEEEEKEDGEDRPKQLIQPRLRSIAMMSARRPSVNSEDTKNGDKDKDGREEKSAQLSYVEKLKNLHRRLEDVIEEEERVRTDIKKIEEDRKRTRKAL
jgi:hypothetical protein